MAKASGVLVLFLVTLQLSACGNEDGRYEELFSGRLPSVDLTYPLDQFSLIWPGYGGGPLKIDTVKSIGRDGFTALQLHFSDHLGTHVDAPIFLTAGGLSVDHFPLSQLFASAVVIDISNQCSKNPDYLLQRRDIEIWEEVYRPIPKHAMVFVYTGWGGYWGNGKKYFNFDRKRQMRFPGVSREAAHYLLQNRDIVGLGIDTASIEGGLAEGFPVHRLLLARQKLVVENVANLDRVPARNAKVVLAPLRIGGGGAAPVRLLAILP